MIPLTVLFLISYIGNSKVQVKKLHTETGFLIIQLPFSRICCEMIQTVSVENVHSVLKVAPVHRTSSVAVKILQTSGKNYIMQYLACKYYVCIYKDIQH